MNKVYFLKCEEFVKVGRSENPISRKRSIQILLPFDLDFIDCFEMPTKDSAVFVEGYIQRKLKSQGLHKIGEWFFLEKDGISTMDEANKILKGLQQECVYSEKIAEQIFTFRRKSKGPALTRIKSGIAKNANFLTDMLNCSWVVPKYSFVEVSALNKLISDNSETWNASGKGE